MEDLSDSRWVKRPKGEQCTEDRCGRRAVNNCDVCKKQKCVSCFHDLTKSSESFICIDCKSKSVTDRRQRVVDFMIAEGV